MGISTGESKSPQDGGIRPSQAWLGAARKRSIRKTTPSTTPPSFSPVVTMAHCERASKPLLQCLRATYVRGLPGVHGQSARGFQSTAAPRDEAQAESQNLPFNKNPDPTLVSSPRLERRLMRKGIAPIGSRRRRAALQNASNIPFEQLPYQCFQEARKILLADREEKLKEIESTRQRLSRLQSVSLEEAGGLQVKKSRTRAMELHLERLKILADINDPLVKRRFEDGLGI